MSALGASADVVTVTPVSEITPIGQMDPGETQLSYGWSIATNRLGWGELSTFGPALYFSRNQVGNSPIIAGDPEVHPNQNLGRGTFYATCDMWVGGTNLTGDRTPSTVWLGTDTWKGQPLHGRTLGSITDMDYFSFVDKCPIRYSIEPLRNQQGWWNKPNYWNGPAEPMQLQFTVCSPSDPNEIRQLWLRPWGGGYSGDDGLNEPGSKKGRWEHIYCIPNHWYKPSTGTSPNHVQRGWMTWAELMDFQEPQGPLPKYRDWKLADPATIWKSPGWDGQTNPTGGVTATATGYPLNFFVGARKTLVKPLFMQPEGQTIRWINQSYGERAQMDYFTLGFAGEGTQTYDFEPDPADAPVRTVACSIKALKDSVWTRQEFVYPPADPLLTFINPPARQNYLVKVTGVVGLPWENYNLGFTIEDGSKLTYVDPGFDPNWTPSVLDNPIMVWLQNDGFRGDPYWIGTGDIVTVEGFIEPVRFAYAPHDYLLMWTNVNKITKHATN